MQKKRSLSASLSDLNEINRINSFSKWSLDDFKAAFKDDSKILLALKEDDQVLGFILFFTVLDSSDLILIEIDPKFRQKNNGFILLKDSLDILIKKGIKEVLLEVSIENISALKLYEKLGFKIVNTIENYYGQGKDAFLMKLELL